MIGILVELDAVVLGQAQIFSNCSATRPIGENRKSLEVLN
jgi:hypothetical protein